MLIGGSVLLFLAYLVLKDVPPFTYHLLLLVTGVMFLWAR